MAQQVLVNEHLSSFQSPEVVNDDISKVDTRIELLERNIRYIQQQHKITLNDLHNEINRLQQENRDLHYRLNNNHSSSSSEQEVRNIDQPSSPTPDPSIDENHLHLEKKIDELEEQLMESEKKNKYLVHKINELNRTSSSKLNVSPRTDDTKTSTQTNDNDYQHLLLISYEKQQEYVQEITKLRSVLVEIFTTERLSLSAKILIRDCLNSRNISQISRSKTTTTPVDMLFTNEKQYRQKINITPSTAATGKTVSFRSSNSRQRPVEQRANLPSIIQGNSSSWSQNSAYVNSLLYHSSTPTKYSQHQHLIKIAETPIARRERRTQELQKNRLMKNLYH